MTPQLSFTEEYHYADDPSGITLTVTLSYGDESVRVFAKVDSGAECCIFSLEDGLNLGIPVEEGIPKVFSTLGGPLEAYGHEVVIQTGDIAFQSLVYFARHPGLLRNLLGRQGWLRNLKLGIIDYDNLLYLSEYDS